MTTLAEHDFPELDDCSLLYEKDKVRVSYDYPTTREAFEDEVKHLVFSWRPNVGGIETQTPVRRTAASATKLASRKRTRTGSCGGQMGIIKTL
jgi:hypothetical protein